MAGLLKVIAPVCFITSSLAATNSCNHTFTFLYSLERVDITDLAIVGVFLYALRRVNRAWLLDLSPKKVGGSTVSFFSGSQSRLVWLRRRFAA